VVSAAGAERLARVVADELARGGVILAGGGGDARGQLVRVREEGAPELGNALRREPELDARETQSPLRVPDA
jgi:hypothetical protein